MPTDITFTIERYDQQKAIGTLSWPTKHLSSPAISGSRGIAAIPTGTYTALRASMLDKLGDNDGAYCDRDSATRGKTGHCWMQPFVGNRELGIHPDGGVPVATEGCIGLQDANTRPWYDAFYAVPRGGQTTILVERAAALDKESFAAEENPEVG